MPKWLRSKNDFKRAIKLIEDIRADTNNFRSSSGNKKVFNNLDKFINEIKTKKLQEKKTIEKIKDIVSDLDQQRQKESAVFQNKMIDVVYYLFNSLAISSKPDKLMLSKRVKVIKDITITILTILITITKGNKEGLKINVDGRKITLDDAESLQKDMSLKIGTTILLMMQKP